MQFPADFEDFFVTPDTIANYAVSVMLQRLESSRTAMQQARDELAAGHGEQALVHAYRAGLFHADVQRASTDLEAVGLDSTILERASHAPPIDIRRVFVSPFPAKTGA